MKPVTLFLTLSFLLPSALSFLAPSALGQMTWIVDDTPGPGVDFNDLPPAVAASGPYDTLIVRPGNYSNTVVDHGLRIVGSGGSTTRVSSNLDVRGIPSNHIVVIAGLWVYDVVHVENCDGVVILEDVRMEQLRVDASFDVRLHRLDAWYAPLGQPHRIVGSRVEIVDSLIRGHIGSDQACAAGDDGELGLDVLASFVHIAGTQVRGGPGGYCNENPLGCCPSFDAADGGPGLDALDSRIILSGLGTGEGVYGGAGGQLWHIWQAPGCPCGDQGRGIFIDGTPSSQPVLRMSDVTVSGIPPLSTGATVAVTTATGDPVMTLGGPVLAGQPLLVEFYGTPGERIQLEFGRNAVRIPVPGSPIEQLCSAERRAQLGSMPPSGVLQIALNVPLNWPTGTVFFMQARLTEPTSGSVRMSNSTPFLVR